MKNGYEQFFANARQVRGAARTQGKVGVGVALNAKKERGPSAKSLSDLSEAELRKLFTPKSAKSNKSKKGRKALLPTVLSIVLCFVGAILTGTLHFFPQLLEGEMPSISFGMFTNAVAETDAATASDNKDHTEKANEASTKRPDVKADAPQASDLRKWSDDELKLLSKLDERNRELDIREERLKLTEEELRRQEKVLDEKLKQMEEVRRQIADKLKDKVEVDQDRVSKLVEFYSNMKPQNAAKVFETIDEDLAVEVLIRMKKKNAADIMNLLPALKSQVLSEKFAGFRSR